MTIVLHSCAVIICILYLAWYFKVSLVEILPVFTCGLVLALYVLAMLHHLSWIDIMAAFVIALFAIRMKYGAREERAEFGKACVANIMQPSFITAFILLFTVALCTSGKVVTWWDDINFWAADVKSLYFLDGFAGRYANVSPEYGDYPPGGQLIKWWFLHLNPHGFDEGFAFVGYYTMNMVFLLPLLRKLKGRNIPVIVLTAVALWLFPSISEVYGYDGFCADLTMACIYGGFLFAVADREGKTESFYYGRLALYLGVLVLIKSIGFIWALFGLLFLFLYLREDAGEQGVLGTIFRPDGSKKLNGAERRLSRRGLLAVILLPAVTGGSWLLFCLLMRRVTRTTATAVKYMTTDEYGISGYTADFAKAFMEAFVSSPLHKDNSMAFDLTPLGLYLCICLLVVFFYRVRILPVRKGKAVLWFSVVSGMLFYGIIFVAHITIFATETQYLEASGMISSIERYGAPFTVGTLLFLAGIWLERGGRLFAGERIPAFVREYGVYLCFILFVALTAGYQVGYHGLIGYRDDTEEMLVQRADMLGEDEMQFLDAVRFFENKPGGRVCYIRRGDAPRWVNNSYMSYEASPVSVVYRSVNLDDAPTDWMVGEIRASHASYLYVEETDADAGAVFDSLLAQDEAFRCGVLYRIVDDGTNMELTCVSQ